MFAGARKRLLSEKEIDRAQRAKDLTSGTVDSGNTIRRGDGQKNQERKIVNYNNRRARGG